MNSSNAHESLRREMRAALEAEIERLRHGQALLAGADEGLLSLTAEALEDTGAAARWLVTAQKGLADKTPLEAAKDPAGAASVRQILNAIEHGVYL